MRFTSSKWSLHKHYLRSPSLRAYLPPTAILTRQSLAHYLTHYQSVYVKPDREHMGRGITRITKVAGGYSVIRVKGRVRRFRTIRGVYRYLRAMSGKSRYIIQKTIPLAKVGGRNFDVRVMMMRNGEGNWEYAGMLAKVAGRGSVITNVMRGGGYAVKVETALAFLPEEQREAAIEQLKEISYEITRHFDSYRRSSQIGIDFGVDPTGQIYLIEVNYDFPSHLLFRLLQDKTYYRNIRRLVAAYSAFKKRRLQAKKK
ncbi:YheC/YheD family protein [Brevibacillus sp. TJ4]